MNAGFVGADDVGAVVAVDVFDYKLSSYTGGVIDEVGFEVGGAVVVTHELEPIDHRRGIGAGILAGTVGPVAFAGDDVFQAVAVHVDEFDGVGLGELDAANEGVGLTGDDGVIDPGGCAVGGPFLFEPTETVFVGVDAGDDVVEAIAVDVVGIHLSAAFGAECGGMEFPEWISSEIGGLGEPAGGGEHVLASVAVDVTRADAVRVAKPMVFAGDGVKLPRRGGGNAFGG